MAVSHIMLEAYKKYVLVSLILHGKVCVNSQMLKFLMNILVNFKFF
jgi:COP9 signalosome complex subunit 3